MPAYNFMPRFAPLVRSGAKTSTIRSRDARVGSVAYLFLGLRSATCELLGKGEIIGCSPISIGLTKEFMPRVSLGLQSLNEAQMQELAKRDGFDNALDMVVFFAAVYKNHTTSSDGGADVFSGHLITWKLEP